jgi:DUF4097 and DUF4098 domain-containing protein YvlB
MKIFVTGFFLFASLMCLSAQAESETRTFDSQGLTHLTIQNTSGKTTVSTVDGPQAIVEYTKNTFSDKCSLLIEKKNTTLVLQVKKSGFFSDADCDIDFNVKVPKAINLDLLVGAGKLSVTGTQGDLNFTLGRGDIVADGSFRKIDGKAGSGTVEIKGLTGGGELKTGSGKINLTFAKEEILKGELSLKTGSGDATLMFPKSAKIKTNYRAGSGKLVSELSENPDADFEVSMRAGSGNLKIKTY